MKKKVALITGASSGIGLETAFELLNRGFNVYGGARRVESMRKIEEKGGHVIYLDVTNEESMVACVNQILEKEGQIDVLVNNAGFGLCGTIEDIPIEKIRNQYEVNVFGLGRMIQLVLPTMRRHSFGKIVNVASMGGRFSSPFCGWYHSTKYAVEAISDALRMEILPYHIDTIVIEPGMIQTDWGVIASKNIRQYSGEGAYKKNADLAADYYEKRYGAGNTTLSDPKLIAKTIGKAVTVKNPKTRYLVGKYAKSFIFLKAILSDKAFQKTTTITMGLKK